MSTNKTQNLNLHSWVETDPVLMREFNENFNAIDAAAQTFGNCRIITGSYVGTGQCGNAYSNRLYFDTAPKWLIITPQSNTNYTGANLHTTGHVIMNIPALSRAAEQNIEGQARLIPVSAGGSVGAIMVSFLDNQRTIVWCTQESEITHAKYQSNDASYTYCYIAIA